MLEIHSSILSKILGKSTILLDLRKGKLDRMAHRKQTGKSIENSPLQMWKRLRDFVLVRTQWLSTHMDS